MQVYVIHENPDWFPPIRRALERAGLPFEAWWVDERPLALDRAPPDGIYLNRMSASAHTRGHAHLIPLAGDLLDWLEGHGRRVINGSRAFALELSKVKQLNALRHAGLRVPPTVAVAGGADALKQAARDLPLPFVTKHNRGGKGLGVRLFESLKGFEAYVDGDGFEAPIDGVTLLQAYVRAPEPFITRLEFVGGEFLYALRSDTRHGFQLCPAEGCQVASVDPQSVFSLREGFDAPIVAQIGHFLQEQRIDVAGVEFVEDEAGTPYVYDVNTTTNYAPVIEEKHGLNGNAALAAFLSRELAAARPLAPRR